jgi:hypothetical protein
MDHDKKKHDRTDDEPVRQGDILGLGGAAVPKTPSDSITSADRTSANESRSIREYEDESHERDTAFRQSPGATGIDMGAGGSGTDVE